MAGEQCAATYKFSREDQDAYAIESYKRAAAAHQAGHFKEETVAVEIKNKKGETTSIVDDEVRGYRWHRAGWLVSYDRECASLS